MLAAFWHMESVVETQTEREKSVRAIERKHAPELEDFTEEQANEVHQKRLQLSQTQNLFGEPVYKEYRWVDSYSTERYCKLINSYSDFHSIRPEQQVAILTETAAYLNQNGGTIEVPQLVQLYLSKKEMI